MVWIGGVGVVWASRPRIVDQRIWLYHVAAIGLLAGLTRYRVPLEPLLMIYAGWFLSEWGHNWQNASVARQTLISVRRVCNGILYDVSPNSAGWVGWRHW